MLLNNSYSVFGNISGLLSRARFKTHLQKRFASPIMLISPKNCATNAIRKYSQ